MKRVLLVLVLAFTFGITDVYASAPLLTTVNEPHVLLVPNTECQEVIYTYLVAVSGGTENLRIETATADVLNGANEQVASIGSIHTGGVGATGSIMSPYQTVSVPCAREARYSIYGDIFDIPAGASEDFTVKVFFTPETAGDYQAVLTGLYFSAVRNGGGGLCMNCVKITQADEVRNLFESKLVGALRDMSEEDKTLVRSFISMLNDLGLLI